MYAMSTERNLEREWRSNLGRWYNRPSVPSWVPSPLDRWWLRLRDEWEQLTLCERSARPTLNIMRDFMYVLCILLNNNESNMQVRRGFLHAKDFLRFPYYTSGQICTSDVALAFFFLPSLVVGTGVICGNVTCSSPVRYKNQPSTDSRFVARVCRLSWGLIGVNAGVFMLLRTPALGSFMYYNFVQRLPPARTPFWTLLTCNFSHMQPLHLA